MKYTLNVSTLDIVKIIYFIMLWQKRGEEKVQKYAGFKWS